MVAPYNGSIFGRRLEEEPEGIGFQLDVTLEGADFVFVVRAFSDTGDEYFPNARQSERTHLMATAIPVVEIAYDADPLGVRRPNGEACASNAVDGAELGAEFVVNAALVAFAEKVKVGLAERWQKRIGVPGAMDLTGFVRNDEVVGIDASTVLGRALEDVALGNALEFDSRLVLFVDGLDFNFSSVWNKGAGDQAGTVVESVQAQQAMGRVSL